MRTKRFPYDRYPALALIQIKAAIATPVLAGPTMSRTELVWKQADAPDIPDRGSYGLTNLDVGPRFVTVIRDLLGVRFRHLAE